MSGCGLTVTSLHSPTSRRFVYLSEPNIKATLPTGLKYLCLDGGKLDNTNIGDVALESFESGMFRRITQDDLQRLPKTLKKIHGGFRPEWLEEQLFEMFPLLDKEMFDKLQDQRRQINFLRMDCPMLSTSFQTSKFIF